MDIRDTPTSLVCMQSLGTFQEEAASLIHSTYHHHHIHGKDQNGPDNDPSRKTHSQFNSSHHEVHSLHGTLETIAYSTSNGFKRNGDAMNITISF